MAPNLKDAKKHARHETRDSLGHFISSQREISPLIKEKTSLTSPSVTPIPEFEQPLVEVAITNPFKKILYWLDQIRRRQTTTFAMKLSIPLIALPVVLVAAFTLGRYTVLPFQKSQTAQASPTPTIIPAIITLSRAGILKIAKSPTKTTYLLATTTGTIINLQIPEKLDLSKYQNKQVLVTGNVDKTTGVLNVTDIAEIQIFNTTVIATQSATLSSTPSAQ